MSGADADGLRPVALTRVLFVCTGNICRSPVAAELWRMRSPRLLSSLSSAGTTAVREGHVPDVLQQMVRLEGGGVSGHRGRQLEAAMIDRADLVLTMTKDQRRWVVRHAPSAIRRTYTLPELARLTRGLSPADLPPRDEDPTLTQFLGHVERHRRIRLGLEADDDIPDPYGRSRRTYRAVLRRIDAAVRDVVSVVENESR